MAGLLEEWEDPSSRTFTYRTAATTNLTAEHPHTTTLPDIEPTFIGDSNMPVYVTDMPSTTANAAVGGISGVGTGVHTTAIGMGSLGMVTVLIMLYNLCAGLGLGVMLWKGVIDWKGNVNDQTSSTSSINPITITVTDSAGTQWFVPLTWVQTAVQRITAVGTTHSNDGNGVRIANAPVELTGYDGNTGHLRLGTMVDAAMQTLRLRAAGLI